MNLGIIQPSDVLRTGGAVFLLTRKTWWVKALGLVWLGSEIYSLHQKETLPAGALVADDEGLLPFTGKSAPTPPPSGDGLAKPTTLGGLGVLLQGYAG